jgi:hypothetical protein
MKDIELRDYFVSKLLGNLDGYMSGSVRLNSKREHDLQDLKMLFTEKDELGFVKTEEFEADSSGYVRLTSEQATKLRILKKAKLAYQIADLFLEEREKNKK